MIRQRQAEGIRIAKEKGVHLGRPRWCRRNLCRCIINGGKEPAIQRTDRTKRHVVSKFYRTCRKLQRQKQASVNRKPAEWISEPWNEACFFRSAIFAAFKLWYD